MCARKIQVVDDTMREDILHISAVRCDAIVCTACVRMYEGYAMRGRCDVGCSTDACNNQIKGTSLIELCREASLTGQLLRPLDLELPETPYVQPTGPVPRPLPLLLRRLAAALLVLAPWNDDLP